VYPKRSDLPALSHVVWDWNGTLLDDSPICVEATSWACELIAGVTVDQDTYRQNFTRPVRLFYEQLLGRSLADGEWRRIVEVFHSRSESAVRAAPLRPEAKAVLEWVNKLGITQSLLSMAEHEHLAAQVEQHGLETYFFLVEGTRADFRTESKQLMLPQHLEALARVRGRTVAPDSILVVGDTTDDAEAAAAVGARWVLLADGLYDPSARGDLSSRQDADLRAAIEGELGPARAGSAGKFLQVEER
jgi:phosphoglycolate phosphatase-like HAD superfamily hydrolase